ncbi:MAG: fructose-bisphosphate aldolase class I [Desulfobacterium sp.]|nr:fructose-bisphosphate aldolase class I [Desulfobacterium sp.]
MTDSNFLTREKIQTLELTAAAMVAKGKGVLAADESSPTIKKRFDTIKVESTEENRRLYRELLFTAPEIENHISGVILFDETLRQSAGDGTPFSKLLSDRGIIPGIKVDKGIIQIPETLNEKVTQGLDGLADRLDEYRQLGARFAKWRAVLSIGYHQPSNLCIALNAHALARYAALSQRAGLVPIVEPEILINGNHDIETCERVTQRTMGFVFNELSLQRVRLEGMILKPSMVTSGDACPEQADVETVARKTIKIFKRSVPSAVPGIAFLSGGQTSQQATAHLNAMNQIGSTPWELSFSYGRALQEQPLGVWKGKPENKAAAQAMLLSRAKCNGEARFGAYTPDMEPHWEMG